MTSASLCPRQNPKTQLSSRQLGGFLATAFASAWLLQLGYLQSDNKLWLLAVMFCPLLSALPFRVARKRIWAGLKRVSIRHWILAIILGAGHMMLAYGLLWASGHSLWNQSSFPLADSGVSGIHGVGTLLGNGPQGFGALMVNLVVSITVASVVFCVGAVGEEAGWRAVLQEELITRLGTFRGITLLGVIWAFWHLPANLSGYNGAEIVWLRVLVFYPLFTVALSFLLAWLWRRSGGSIWVVAIAHSANNVVNAPFVVDGSSWVTNLSAQTASSILILLLFAGLLWCSPVAVFARPPLDAV